MYQPRSDQIFNSITYKYSFSGRPKSISKSKRNYPGPGNYNVDINLVKNHGPVFGSSKRAELENQLLKKMPGPGAYNLADVSVNTKVGPK